MRPFWKGTRHWSRVLKAHHLAPAFLSLSLPYLVFLGRYGDHCGKLVEKVLNVQYTGKYRPSATDAFKMWSESGNSFRDKYRGAVQLWNSSPEGQKLQLEVRTAELALEAYATRCRRFHSQILAAKVEEIPGMFD